jgi:hypothetical protein
MTLELLALERPANDVWQDPGIAVMADRRAGTAGQERLEELLASAAEFFETSLWEVESSGPGRTALDERDLKEKTIRAYGVGFAPVGHSILMDHLDELGFSADEMVDSGLINQSAKGHRHAHFRSRVMFPIRDADGRILGFAGLATHLGPSWPLWVTLPDTSLYRRSEAVFGLDLAARKIRSSGTAAIKRDCVEVLRAHQEGERNAVAVHSSLVTREQMRVLSEGLKGGIDKLELDLPSGMRAEPKRGPIPEPPGPEPTKVPIAPDPPPHVEVKRLALVIATGLVAMNVWTGSPLLAIWIGSQAQSGQVLSLWGVVTAFAVLGVFTFLLGSALTWLSAKYDEITGRPRLAGQTSPWHRAKRGDRVQDIRARFGMSAPERVVAVAVVAAVIALEIWFFFFAGSPFAD